MTLDDGAVERDRLDLDAHDLRLLQALEHPVQHTALGPAIHARVDRVPVAEPLGQATPLAAVLGHVQDGVQHPQIRYADVASLQRQTLLDLRKLRFGDLHLRSVGRYPSSIN
jgi:hypothetical protein